MAHSKAEVWAAANAAGLADGVRAISKAFPGAITDLSVSIDGYATIATSDEMLHDRVRIVPGAGCDAEESARIRAESRTKPNQRYKK